MKKELKSWIFAVSANPYLDYRTLIAPDFLCQAKKTSLLARNAGGDLTDQKKVYIDDQKVGQLTLIFRVMEAIANDFRIEGDGVLKDPFGREIYLTEGLVFKGKLSNIQLTIEDFDNIHNEVKDNFRDFWEWVTPQQAIESQSKPIEVDRNVIIEQLSKKVDQIELKKQEIEKEISSTFNKIEDQRKKKLGTANFQKSSIQILLLFVLFLIIVAIVLIKLFLV